MQRYIALAGVLSAGAVGFLAAPSSASTVSLSSGDNGGGLNLDAGSVLAASGPLGGVGYDGSNTLGSYQVQGATFLKNTTGTVTNAATGVSIAISNNVAGYGGDSGSYAASSEPDEAPTSPGDFTASPNDTVASPQPTDIPSANLKTILDSNTDSTPQAQFTVTISGLTAGDKYSIDMLETVGGYNGREQTITYNDGTTETAYLYQTNTANTNNFYYDTNDTITADPVTGNITATVAGDYPVLEGVVVSSVPEPSAIGMACIAGLRVLRRRRRV